MSEEAKKETKENLRWVQFSEKPNTVHAIQYIEAEKDGRKLSNFQNFLKRAGVNGRVYQDIDCLRVSSKNGRMQLRDTDWLVEDRFGEFLTYKDVDFHKMYDNADALDANLFNVLNDRVKALEDSISKLIKDMANTKKKWGAK